MLQRGFTLLELLLSIAIIGLLAGLSVPVYQSLQTNRTADSERDQVVALVRRAQVRARAGDQNTDWGVFITSDRATLFQGNDFLNRDADFDEVVMFSNMTAEPDSEIIFENITGRGNTDISIDFATTNNYSFNITINHEGVIEW